MEPVNLLDYEEIARSRLPKPFFDFIAGGSQDEVTLRNCREAFGHWRLLPRVMTGNATPSLTTTVLGQEISMPVIVAPMGLHRLAHPDGELATAAAAQRAGTIYSLSIAASQSVEAVAATTNDWWFQTYLLKERAQTLEIVQRAEQAGAGAIILTVDVPVRGRREADFRNNFEIPADVSMPNLNPAGYDGPWLSYAAQTAWQRDISWSDLDWLVANTHLPVVVKGILSPEDGLLAVEHGAKAIVVSNHGGRQLDSAVASIDALPAVVTALGGSAEVYLDSGIRRGGDVLKALALGARAVMLGRPVLFGLAADGAAGVDRVLSLLREELTTDCMLCGIGDVTMVGQRLVVRAQG